MESKLTKERLYFRCPTPQLLMAAEVRGDGLTPEALTHAVRRAVSGHALLRCRVRLDGNEAFFTDDQEAPPPEVRLETAPFSWDAAVAAEEKRIFHPEDGETVRFRIYPACSTGIAGAADETCDAAEAGERGFAAAEAGGLVLLCSASHLVCDVQGLTYLFRDILTALAEPERAWAPQEPQLYDPSKYARTGKVPFALKLMISTLNRQWKREEKVFTSAEYTAMFDRYWADRRTAVQACAFDDDETAALKTWCDENDVSLSTALAAAFALAAEESGVGLSLTVRDKDYTGMGNFATGISADFFPSADTGFAERVRDLESQFRRKLLDPKLRYFQLSFMNRISPGLTDAAYFAAFGGYTDRYAAQAAGLFGFNGQSKGVSLTSAGDLPIPMEYGAYRLEKLSFVPPLVPGCQRFLGAGILNGCLTVTMHYDRSREEEMRSCFEKAIGTLKRQAKAEADAE